METDCKALESKSASRRQVDKKKSERSRVWREREGSETEGGIDAERKQYMNSRTLYELSASSGLI